MTGPASLELVRAFGQSAARFMQASNRDTFTAPLFNVPGRLVVGSHCFVEHLPDLLTTIGTACEPAEIGRRMGTLGSRPNYVNLSAIMFGYLNGREQQRLLAAHRGRPISAQHESVALDVVTQFWSTTAEHYLRGAPPLPEARGWHLRTINDTTQDDLVSRLGPPLPASARRLVAVAELFTFALNGEARVGVFNHGPYPVAEGGHLIVKELVGLRSNEIGWPALSGDIGTAIDIDSLVRVQHVRGVETRIDLFGSIHTEPAVGADELVSEALLAVTNGAVVALDDAAIDRLTSTLNEAMLAIYRETITWPPLEQVSYGWRLYAGLLLAFADVAGVDLRADVNERFSATASRVAPGIAAADEPLLILEQLGRSAQPYTVER